MPSESLGVAIVGRPNVGKSTLFNRLVGRRGALVDKRAGVTRDVVEGVGSLADLRFCVVDTPGLEGELQPLSLVARKRGQRRRDESGGKSQREASPDMFSKFATALRDDDDEAYAALYEQMAQQTRRVLDDNRRAGLALFVIDALEGVLPADREIARLLRQRSLPVVLVANKCEANRATDGHAEASAELGFGEAVPISAEHGEGMAELFAAMAPHVDAFERARHVPAGGGDQDADDEDAEDSDASRAPPRVCIVGRPNAGKSTLVNALVGEQRLVTGPYPGVTRDAVSVYSRATGLTLVDTAGIRRRLVDAAAGTLAQSSVGLAKQSMRRADVCCLVLDASSADAEKTLAHNDLRVIREATADFGRPLVFIANKCDCVPAAQRAPLERALQHRIETASPDMRGAPLLMVSALNEHPEQLARRIADAVHLVHARWARRVPTSGFSRWLRAISAVHPAPRQRKFAFGKQMGTRPPSFTVYGVAEHALPAPYRRMLLNACRREFELEGVPVRMRFRSRRA